MKKLLSLFAAPLLALLVMTTLSPAIQAQSFGSQEAVGTWTFYIKIAGAPPCQCIQLSAFRADGTLDGPANDHFSGAALGLWKKTGFRDITFSFVQNNINADGSAGGVYVIKGVMTLNPTGDQSSGNSTFQLIDNSGKVLFAGTATFTATKLKLD